MWNRSSTGICLCGTGFQPVNRRNPVIQSALSAVYPYDVAISPMARYRTIEWDRRPPSDTTERDSKLEGTIMRNAMKTTAAVIAVAALATAVGCVVREERISIARDGAVVVELEITGGVDELADGDAMPSAKSGWNVTRKIEMDNDEEELVLASKRRFEPGRPLPDSFAADGDEDADLYLHFPTTLRTEDRADGMYFFFRRTYDPRPWAYMQHWKDFCFDDGVKKLGEKRVEELTFEERRRVIQAFACDEAFKQIELARVALAECEPDLPIEYALMAREALIRFYKEDEFFVDRSELQLFEGEDDYLDSLIKRCDAMTEPQRDLCYDDEATRLLDAALTAFEASLQKDARFNFARLTRFESAYDRAQRKYEISNELGGHHFEIEIEMPGTIIAHNAENMDVDKDDAVSSAKWQFEGKVLRDRPHELIAVSRLAWDQVQGSTPNEHNR